MRGSSVCVNQQDTPYSVAHADAPLVTRPGGGTLTLHLA